MRRSLRFALVPLFVLAMLWGAAGAQAFPEVGVSQSYRDFGLNLDKGTSYEPNRDISRSVYWSPLGVKKLRVIVPWDIADRGPGDGRVKEFVNWLKRAKELEAVPFVVFAPTERSPSTDTAHSPAHFSNVQTRCCSPEALVVPPTTVYRTAVEDFLATWGPGTAAATGVAEVRTIGAWNEPNVDNVAMGVPGGINGRVFLTGGSTLMYETGGGVCPSGSSTDSNCGPLAAARLWNNARVEMSEVCSTCTVVAGEFDSDGLTNGPKFWALYAEKIEVLGSARPQVMSFHGHHDVEELGSHGASDCTSTNTQYCITRNFSQWLKGKGGAWASIPIWDTEVGAQHSAGTSPSSDDIAQRNRFNNLIDLENTYGVSRFYYYNFQQQNGSNDRGLIDSAENGANPGGVNTRQRPIWDTIRCRSTSGCAAWSLPAPVVTTGGASNIAQTTATIAGSVNPNGTTTAYYVEYGPTTSYGTKAPEVASTVSGNNTTAVPVSVNIAGLQPNTTYHYRVVGLNFNAPAGVGSDQTFTTSGPTVAARSNVGEIWTYTSGGVNLHLTTKAGTSPAIAAIGGGNTAIAWQGNTDSLWVISPQTGIVNTGIGMAAGTSPSIAPLVGGGWQAAVESNAGQLWTYDSQKVITNLTFGMKAGTSPAIAGLAGGGSAIVWQGTSDSLWVISPQTGILDTKIGMAAGTSPAIVGLSGGSWSAAVQSNVTDLWTWTPGWGGTNTHLGMSAGTSPSIAGA